MRSRHLKITFRFSPAFLRWNAAALILLLTASEVGSESVSLTTYYPAPSGVYVRMLTTGDTQLARDGGRLHVGSVSTGTYVLNVNGDMEVEQVRYMAQPVSPPLKPGETVPAAGTLYYNSTRDQFYYASASAIASDRTTWYKPVSGVAGLDIGLAKVSYNVPFGTTSLHRWNALPTTPATMIKGSSGQIVRTPLQSAGGFFTAAISGTYCVKSPVPGDTGKTPTLKLYWRRWNSGGTSSWLLAATVSVTNDELVLDSTGLRMCADVSMATTFVMGTANVGIDVQVNVVTRDPTVNLDNLNLDMAITKVLSF